MERNDRANQQNAREGSGLAQARSETPGQQEPGEQKTQEPGTQEAGTGEGERNDKARAAGTSDEEPFRGQVNADEEPIIKGYGPFRLWANREIRKRQTTLPYGGVPCEVEELTNDGQLRLKVGEGFAIVPLDERYIPELFHQLLSE
jgi:hypothetical protein